MGNCANIPQHEFNFNRYITVDDTYIQTNISADLQLSPIRINYVQLSGTNKFVLRKL